MKIRLGKETVEKSFKEKKIIRIKYNICVTKKRRLVKLWRRIA